MQLTYYQNDNRFYCSANPHLPLPHIDCLPEDAAFATYLFEQQPDKCRCRFTVNHSGQLCGEAEHIGWLNSNSLQEMDIPPKIRQLIDTRSLSAVNHAHPLWQKSENSIAKKGLRLNLLAIGDVGSTLLIGLRLLAQDTISEIGIYDINPANCIRWEMELNQIAQPFTDIPQPQINIITKDQLFDGDVFVFCATAGIPPLNTTADVRLIQYEHNAKIIGEYATMARQQHYRGLFAVVSDPVDLLCRSAFNQSNCDEQGVFDGKGLLPEQIEGYGLGVMHGRACYYARKEARFAHYLMQGRSYGPHGEGLIIADSIDNYNDELSDTLTHLARTANLRAREAGYKPYVAPALSSGALSLISTLRGEWHYSSTFLAGVFMGAKNRRLNSGVELEHLPLPQQLAKRIAQTSEYLASFNKEDDNHEE